MLVSVSVILFTFGRQTLPLPRTRCALILCLIGELTIYVRYGFEIETEQFRLAILLCFAVAGVLVAFSKDKAAAVLVGVAVIATTGLVAMSRQGLPVAFDQFAETPAHIAFLREAVGEGSVNGRVLASKRSALPNGLSAYGIAELPSLNPFQVTTTAEYILKTFSKRRLSGSVAVMWGATSAEEAPNWADYVEQRRFYNAVGVRFLMDAPNGELSRMSIDGLTQIYSDEWATIYEDARHSRAPTLLRVSARSECGRTARLLLDPGFDPTRQALVERERSPYRASWSARAVADLGS